MKKNKIKNYLKIGVFLFGISLIFLASCEKENNEIINPQNAEQSIDLDFKLENLTLSQADLDSTFSRLKTTFDIETPIYNPKERKYLSKIKNVDPQSTTSKDFSDLDPSIDMSIIRKITTPNYISYTMRINEPQNTTNSFSNIVIQESNGVQEIFTFKYTPSEIKSEENKTFEGTYTMRKGPCLQTKGGCWDEGGGGGGGDNMDGFEYVCIHTEVLVPVACGCGHMPWDTCYGCDNYSPSYPGWRHEIKEECSWEFVGDNGNNSDNNSGNDSDNNSGGGGTSNTGGGVTTSPIINVENCDGGKIPNAETGECECPDGETENENGICTPICSNGQIYNTSTKSCECPDGETEDVNGNCVEQPCEGDPIKNPSVAKQNGSSGIKGALQGCTRYGGSCTSPDGRTKSHEGIDLKNEYGKPIFAMYDGFIYSTKNDPDGAGYFTRIQGTINGETFLVEYFHLQQENRILQGNNPLVYVHAGDIIGYQGDSGNLKKAIADGGVESHVHIEVKVHDGSSNWGYGHFSTLDPRSYLSTTIDDNGQSTTNTNCN